MDVMMPIMDGIQAARQMRGLCGDRLRIVGMSADVDEQGQEDAVRAGMNSLDRKPTSYADLERLLRPKAPI
jgi:CheY-like chemotaxis protein